MYDGDALANAGLQWFARRAVHGDLAAPRFSDQPSYRNALSNRNNPISLPNVELLTACSTASSFAAATSLEQKNVAVRSTVTTYTSTKQPYHCVYFK